MVQWYNGTNRGWDVNKRKGNLLVPFLYVLKVPLNCESWVNKELLIVIGVINKVVANLYLGTDAEMLGGVVPQLRLGKQN